MRLHPAASRIWKLSAETPARLVVFDTLGAPDGKRLMELSLKRRRSALDAFGKRAVQGQLIISPYTRDREQAKPWLMDFGRGRRTI
jgi:ATP-dependent DNA ligase